MTQMWNNSLEELSLVNICRILLHTRCPNYHCECRDRQDRALQKLIVWLNITVSVCQTCTILLLIMQFLLKRTLEWKSEGFIPPLSAIDLTMKTTGESLPLFETQLHLLKGMLCTVYNSQVIESTSMFINRWMDKEVMVPMYNELLLNHKKEQIWISSSEVDEPRAWYTEWSESEREKQILFINTYIWKLEKWYWWSYLQGRNRNPDIENRPVTQQGKVRMGWIGRTVLKHIHYHM